jgi:ubiquinone/menaquinone biosynthesis C-methylase UbiE
MNSTESVAVEISRLTTLGWKQVIEVIDEQKISFHNTSFDPSGNNIEKDGFWAQHRVQIILDYLKKNSIDLLWEIGAGDGNVSIPLSQENISVIAVEPLKNGSDALRKSNIFTLNSTLEKINLPAHSIHAVGLFDVLGHAHHPAEMLKEVHRVMQPKGHLLIAVPAYGWLFSDYDLSIRQIRRFSLKEIKKLIEDNGFEVSKARFAFAALVPLSIVFRLIPYKLGRRSSFQKMKRSTLKISKISTKFNRSLSQYFRIEYKLNLQFGLSIFVFARRNE